MKKQNSKSMADHCKPAFGEPSEFQKMVIILTAFFYFYNIKINCGGFIFSVRQVLPALDTILRRLETSKNGQNSKSLKFH